MAGKKEKRGRKALSPEQKKPPQPTVKINPALYPFVKQLKQRFKAGLVDDAKLAALTATLLGDEPIATIGEQAAGTLEENFPTDGRT